MAPLTPRQQREREFWNKASSVQVYENWREQSYESWKSYRPLQTAALDFLGPVEGKRLLLCGIGSEAAIFARAGAQVYGFDISETTIAAVEDLAKRLDLTDSIMVSAQPFEALSYPDSFFDLAFGDAILHHVELDQAGAELRRVLRSGGRASFIEPLGMNPFLEFARRYLPYRDKGRTEDEIPLRYSDIRKLTDHFEIAMWREFSLFAMLRRRIITNRRIIGWLERLDQKVLKIAPYLRCLCAAIWIGVEKR